MKTAKEREEAFRKDFQELLTKHNAEVDIMEQLTDHYLISVIEVIMPGKWDADGNQIDEYTEFKL